MKIGIEELTKIKGRENNPNQMSKDQMESLKKSINKFGELSPILLDQNNVIIDGHQRVEAYKQLGKTQIPIIRLNLEKEADKLILSQIMNKLKGRHDPLLDAVEFKNILENTDMEELISLTAISEQEILNLLEKSEKLPSEGVDRLGQLEITCPHCGGKFKKKDSK